MEFTLLYHDCLNVYGWQKRAESQISFEQSPLPEEDRVKMKIADYLQEYKDSPFTSVNNLEYAPDICNEFATVYFPRVKDKQLAASDMPSMIQFFCHWAYENQLTCSKLDKIVA